MLAVNEAPNLASLSVQLIKPESSGVMSSPTRFVESCNAFTPMLETKPGLSSGRAVLILIVAPIPPDAMLALPVLYTSTDLTLSDAKFAKSKARELGVPPPEGNDAAGIVRPFRVTIL